MKKALIVVRLTLEYGRKQPSHETQFLRRLFLEMKFQPHAHLSHAQFEKFYARAFRGSYRAGLQL